MSSSQIMQPNPRSNPVVWLLGATVLALFALVIVLALNMGRGREGSGDTGKDEPSTGRKPTVVTAGQSVGREELKNPPKPPKPIDPERIAGSLEEGRTYEMVIKGDARARATNSSWGETTIVFVQYLFECAVDRTIEKNDGNTIVEVRHYKVVRNAQVDAKVEEVSLNFGLPGELALFCLESVLPGSYVVFDSLQPFATDFQKNEYQRQLDQQAKVRGAVDSLSGKKVRLTFRNGEGVTSIEPIGCELSSDEKDYIFATAVLADCFIMPDLKIKPGATWTVDGQNLAGLIDPSLRGDTSGVVTVARREDTKRGKHQAAVLEMTNGRVVIDSTTPERYDIGTFSPRGKLIFDLEDQFVESADLTGNISIENCSRDHILYETSFRTKPEITITYTCKIR